MDAPLPKLSVVVPARNEEECVAGTLSRIAGTLCQAGIPFEIVLVDDGSTDATGERARALQAAYPQVAIVRNAGQHGFGMAVRTGLQHATGEILAIMMADASDSPDDLVCYYHKILEGFDCVFGSRFIRGSRVVGYRWHKLALNRAANLFIRILFGLRFNDITNAFKCYRREVVEGMYPLISPHFNLTVEMPLKAIVRGYSFAVVPIGYTNRQAGVAKLKLKEMGSRYLFIVLYLWLERHLARGDYRRPAPRPAVKEPRLHAR